MVAIGYFKQWEPAFAGKGDEEDAVFICLQQPYSHAYKLHG